MRTVGLRWECGKVDLSVAEMSRYQRVLKRERRMKENKGRNRGI